jgi:hypothetical protein
MPQRFQPNRKRLPYRNREEAMQKKQKQPIEFPSRSLGGAYV